LGFRSIANIPTVANVPPVSPVAGDTALIPALAKKIKHFRKTDYRTDTFFCYWTIKFSDYPLYWTIILGNYQTINYRTKESNYWTIDYRNQQLKGLNYYCS
jgi:hypothetical protein